MATCIVSTHTLKKTLFMREGPPARQRELCECVCGGHRGGTLTLSGQAGSAHIQTPEPDGVVCGAGDETRGGEEAWLRELGIELEGRRGRRRRRRRRRGRRRRRRRRRRGYYWEWQRVQTGPTLAHTEIPDACVVVEEGLNSLDLPKVSDVPDIVTVITVHYC